MMNEAMERKFLKYALEMGKWYRETQGPLCSECEEKTTYSTTIYDTENEEFLVFWSCSCGNIETQQWVRSSKPKAKENV